MLDRRSVLLASAALLLAAAPAAAEDKADQAASPARIRAIASFSILGDFVKTVGGDRLDVTTLVGPNGDAHVYRALARRRQDAGRARIWSSSTASGSRAGSTGW